MKAPSILASFFVAVFISLFSAAGYTQTVQVTVLNGEEIRCYPDSVVQIRITPNPAFAFTEISLDWGDGTMPVVINPGDPLVLMHAYPLAQYLDDCSYGAGCPSVLFNGFCFQIAVLANYTGAPSENVQKILTFRFPPRPNFISDPAAICAGAQVSFDNRTCPDNDNSMRFTWQFHDGSTQTTTDATFTYLMAGSYSVTLTAANYCDTVTTTRNVNVQPLAIALAVLDSGSIASPAPVDTVCLTAGGIVRLHAAASQFETRRNWRVIPNSGFQLIGPANQDTVRYDFNTPGPYSIILEVDNGCNTPDYDTIRLVVLPRLSLDLAPQEDDCPSLSYSPSPLMPGVIYTVNGVETPASAFPMALTATGTSPLIYTISARVSNTCETLVRRDTFVVFPAIDPLPLSPASDTIICPDTTLLPLSAFPAGVIWEGTGVVFINGQYSFDADRPAGAYPITYRYGAGDCERMGSLVINVQNVLVDVGGPVSVCAGSGTYTIAFSPMGGQWSGPGIADAALGIFEPDTAGAGVHTLFYTYPDPTTGCTVTRSKIITVVALPTGSLADTLPDICRANTLLSLPTLAGLAIQPGGGTPQWTGVGITDATTGIFNPSLIPANVASTVVSYTYSIPPGCIFRDSVVVLLGEIVPVTAGEDRTVCGNQSSITLSGMPSGGQWSGSNVDAASGVVNVAALAPGAYTYTYTRFPGTSCEASDALTLTIEPANGVSLAFSTVYVCDTASVVRLPAAMPLPGSWSGQPGISGDTAFIVPGAGLYPLTFTASALPPGCNTAILTVDVQPGAVAAIAGDDLGCAAAGCVQLTNMSTNADTYLWQFGDGNSSMAFEPCHTFANEADYEIVLHAFVLHPVTGANLCTDTDTATVRVLAPPTAADIGITAASDPAGCADLTVSFAGTATGQLLEWEWSFGNIAAAQVQQPPAVTFPQGIEDTVYVVQLVVRNACGEDLAELSVTVLPRPRADLGVTFDQPCSGDTLYLTNRSTGNPAISRWELSTGETFNTFEPPFIVPFTGDVPTTLGVWLYVNNQCGEDSVYTEVQVLPTDVQAQFNRSADRVCLGQPLRLTNISTPLAPVRWLTGDGNAFVGDTLWHTFTDSGIYNVTLYAYGCGFDSVVWPIEVLPLPEGVITVETIPCADRLATIRVETQAAAQILYYGTGDSTLLRVSQYAYPAAGNYTARARLISDFGCEREIFSPIVVLAPPVAAAAVVDSVCAGQPVAFSSTSTGAESCLWLFGDGSQADLCQTDYTYPLSGGYLARLVAISSFGCRDTLLLPVYVRPTPQAAFSFELPPTCSPTPVTFLNTTQTATSYHWSFGDGGNSTAANPVHTYDSGSNYTVSLIASYEGICFDTLYQPIVIRGTPRFDTLVLDERCLPDDPWVMEIAPAPGVALDNILVTGPDNFIAENINDRVTLSVPGAYTLTLIAINGCEASLPFFVPSVDPIIVQTIPDTTINWGDEVRLTTRINTANASLIWTPDSRLSDPAALSPLAAPLQTTTYVIQAARDGCAAYDTVTVKVLQEANIYFPNAFSPNGDGANDVYTIFIGNDSIRVESFKVFSRWDGLVYLKDNPDIINGQVPTWDGLDGRDKVPDRKRAYNPGVFVYVAEVRMPDNSLLTFKGDIHLVR